MTLRLYNTLTHSVEPFHPLNPSRVGIYVCGPTVYDVPHIGHARSAYVFDVVRRYLTSRGDQVTFVRNVTDVDDKIIERARQELAASTQHTAHSTQDAGHSALREKCAEVAERYLKSYHEAMDRLGIARPDIEPKATEHVTTTPDGFGSMTDVIAQLFTAGVAYEAKGDVYFAVRKFPEYGRLSNRSLEGLQAGARIEPGEHKQDPLDFALWKAAKPGEPSWESPWGSGRPGWHIECSTMSTKYLGETFDIHGGGVDLVFPHHENEVAQARAAGKPFARCWMHHGLLTVGGEKMSKSLGNYLTVEHVLDAYPHPDYLKLFFLKTHYRSPIDYSPERMDEAKKNWEEFARFFQHAQQRGGGGAAPGPACLPVGTAPAMVADCIRKFQEAMDDDLNTPKALAVLFELVNQGQRMEAISHIRDALLACGTTLGLFLQGMSEEFPQEMERVGARIAERDAARQVKDFARADDIRAQLRQEGILLMDTPSGTVWHRAR